MNRIKSLLTKKLKINDNLEKKPKVGGKPA